jgi:Recombination endonuclease VII
MSPLSDEEKRRRKREYERRYKAANPEKVRELARRYREANREKLAEAKRRYAAENPEKVREYRRSWYAGNREKKREAGRQWYRANRERQLKNTHESRLLRRHGMLPGERAVMWDAQEGKCYLCTKPMDPASSDLDHDHRCCGQGESCRWCRRGLACHACNVIIGIAEDDPDLLIVIAANLRIALAAATERLTTKPTQEQLFAEGGEAS